MPKKIDLNGNSTNLFVSVEGLQAIVDRYKHERYVFVTEHFEPDSRAIWISKSKVLELFNRNPTATGMRLYYGVIDDSKFGHHKSAHNLLFVSTVDVEDGKNDLKGDNDWVIVTQNIEQKDLVDPQCYICPPPDPCSGEQLYIK